MYNNVSSKIDDSETLSHFIFNKAHIKKTAPYLKAGAFRIDKKRPAGEMSVYRCSLIEKSDCIWEISFNFVTQKMVNEKRVALGRATFTTNAVRQLGCNVKHTPNPHPLHCDVISSHLNDVKQVIIAKSLAEKYAAWEENPKLNSMSQRLGYGRVSNSG